MAGGKFTSGRAGYLAYKSTETGGTLRYLPMAGFNPYINRGDATVDLVNNTAYAANKADGITTAQFSLAVPLIPAAFPADSYTRIFGAIPGDDELGNYWTITRAIDATATAADVYAKVKFSGISGGVQFSTNGAAQAVGISLSGMSFDPLSGSVTALAAPSAGALSTGKVLGFSKTAITGASHVVSVNFQVATGLQIVPGVVAGTNANYPYLALGGAMTQLTGSVSITQARKATTILGADGTPGTLVLSIGGTGNGLSFTFKLNPSGVAQPSNLGFNYITSSYYLQSIDGTTSPFVVADL